MRIGTWNLEGRWSLKHLELIEEMDCDVLLLTEVSEHTELPRHRLHLGEVTMAPGRRWAGIASRAALEPLPDPHPASALAVTDGWTMCASVLPWRGSGGGPPWSGETHAERTRAAVESLGAALPTERLVWGGDWNHATTGPEHAGSKAGREHLLAVVARRRLVVSTGGLDHRIAGLLTIDHVATPLTASVTSAQRVVGERDGARLSDHDAYVVDVELT